MSIFRRKGEGPAPIDAQDLDEDGLAHPIERPSGPDRLGRRRWLWGSSGSRAGITGGQIEELQHPSSPSLRNDEYTGD